MLTSAVIQEWFDYAPDSGSLIWRKSFHKYRIGTEAGTRAADGYIEIAFAGRRHHAAHRLVWLWHGRELPEAIDHINGDPSDNRIENLRAANKGENMRNMKLRASNRSGIKGVFFDKTTGKWRARLMVNRKIVECGRFDDLELASLVIAEARDKHHGAFARHR